MQEIKSSTGKKTMGQDVDVNDSMKPIWINKDPKKNNESEYCIMVATPVHSDVSIHYTQSLLEMQKFCFAQGIKIMFHLLKSSLVTQGRNLCAAAFLNNKEATHMLFIDSDIDFEPESIYNMLKKDKDVISIPYPLKTFDWDKGYHKFKEGEIKSGRDLMLAMNNYPVKIQDIEDITVVDGVMELTHSPTGCMLIKRSTIEKMIESYPHMKIKQNTIINGKSVETPNMYNFFDTHFDPETQTYHGEDFAFCMRWKALGGKCHAYIKDYISHVGEHQYSGRFADELKRID